MRKKTHKEFLEDLYIKNKTYREGLLKIIGKYNGKDSKLLVENMYGILSVIPNNLLKGRTPIIKSAVDKTSYWINMAIEVHGDKYDYSKVVYINNSTEVIIICSVHGEFKQTPANHLKGAGCIKCGYVKMREVQTYTTEIYIEKANDVHNNRYTYPRTIYTNSKGKIIATCEKHGDFEQYATTHLMGGGCPKCGREATNEYLKKHGNGWTRTNWKSRSKNSKNFDSFKVYIIKCWNEDEEFYKIGRTYQKVKRRFHSQLSLPYNFEIIKIVEGKPDFIYDLENLLQKHHKDLEYIPELEFDGMYECYTELNLEEINKY